MAGSVLLVSEAPIATVQILSQLLRHVESAHGIRFDSVIGRVIGELELAPDAFPLVVRSCDAEALTLTRILRRNGISYGYYLDDNFWELDPATEIGRHYASRPVRLALEEMVTHAAVVVAATPLLATYMRRFTPRVVHLDAPVDLTQMPPLAPITATTLRMGFAGSLHRSNDLEQVADAVHRALERHPDLEVEVIGATGGLGSHPRIREFAHLESYEAYVALQRSREWSFALAPLGTARSNAYKTDNKYREYAALGIPAIYEDAPPYAAVRDGETGVLVGPGRGWEEAIEQLIASAELRRRIREAARADIERRCSPEVVGNAWAAFLTSMPPCGAEQARFAQAQRGIGARPSRCAARLARLRSLWLLGWHVLAAEGIVAAAVRTARFVGKRRRHDQSGGY